MEPLPKFFPYLLRKSDWVTAGVREDTPEDIKKEYEDYVKWEKEHPHIKI